MLALCFLAEAEGDGSLANGMMGCNQQSLIFAEKMQRFLHSQRAAGALGRLGRENSEKKAISEAAAEAQAELEKARAENASLHRALAAATAAAAVRAAEAGAELEKARAKNARLQRKLAAGRKASARDAEPQGDQPASAEASQTAARASSGEEELAASAAEHMGTQQSDGAEEPEWDADVEAEDWRPNPELATVKAAHHRYLHRGDWFMALLEGRKQPGHVMLVEYRKHKGLEFRVLSADGETVLAEWDNGNKATFTQAAAHLEFIERPSGWSGRPFVSTGGLWVVTDHWVKECRRLGCKRRLG